MLLEILSSIKRWVLKVLDKGAGKAVKRYNLCRFAFCSAWVVVVVGFAIIDKSVNTANFGFTVAAAVLNVVRTIEVAASMKDPPPSYHLLRLRAMIEGCGWVISLSAAAMNLYSIGTKVEIKFWVFLAFDLCILVLDLFDFAKSWRHAYLHSLERHELGGNQPVEMEELEEGRQRPERPTIAPADPGPSFTTAEFTGYVESRRHSKDE